MLLARESKDNMRLFPSKAKNPDAAVVKDFSDFFATCIDVNEERQRKPSKNRTTRHWSEDSKLKVKKLKDYLINHGYKNLKVTLHGIRKAAATFLASWSGISRFAMNIRMGWTNGTVQDCYDGLLRAGQCPRG